MVYDTGSGLPPQLVLMFALLVFMNRTVRATSSGTWLRSRPQNQDRACPTISTCWKTGSRRPTQCHRAVAGGRSRCRDPSLPYGDAVRDLTSGHAVRELEVAVNGNALKLKKPLEKLGGKLWGEDELSRSLYLCFRAPCASTSSARTASNTQAGQAGLSSRLHAGGPPPPRLHRKFHGHLPQRGVVRLLMDL